MGLRNVGMGSTGPDVRAIQQGLNKYYRKKLLVEDGIFGNNTDQLVRRFQTEKRMVPPDGIVGPITRSALFPLVGVTVNFWGQRSGDPAPRTLSMRNPGRARLNIGFGIPLPIPIPMPLPSGLFNGLVQNDVVKPPGAFEAVPTPKIATPPGGRIVVDWQQVMQTQRQFDGLFQNQQDSFAIGWQSVFKRKQLNENDSHLEIATGCLLQSPIGFQDGQGNDFTLACFAQATWVESLGRSGIFQWAPYVQAQGQGNLSGPVNGIGSLAGFPINFNVNLGKIDNLGFDDVTLQVGGGAIGSLKFTPEGLKTTWGPVFGVGLQGKIWFLGN